MALTVTKKAVCKEFNNIVRVGYCNAQFLLNNYTPTFQTCGVYGWNANIYVFDGIVICTGYRPFGKGNEKTDRIIEEYNTQCYGKTVSERDILLNKCLTELRAYLATATRPNISKCR